MASSSKNKHQFYFDPFNRGLAVFLGPTEAELMELAWKHKELTVKKALYLLNDGSGRAYTTIMTVLSRLEKKGFLFREKHGRSFVYRPVSNKKAFLKKRLDIVRKCIEKFSS